MIGNPTTSRQRLSVLSQIPEGALPLHNGFYTRGIPVTLEPYKTGIVEYYFYFPETGKFPHYPDQVTSSGQFIVSSSLSNLNVVEKLSETEAKSWEYVSQNGSDEEVLKYIGK